MQSMGQRSKKQLLHETLNILEPMSEEKPDTKIIDHEKFSSV